MQANIARENDVLTCGDLPPSALEKLFSPFGLQVIRVADGGAISGSHWGAPEAGLLKDGLYLRRDTPVHSALHEGCHWIAMDDARRSGLDTDAGGDDLEECGVCYLQILLADHLPGVGRKRLCQDMDTWGYSFRLGSTRAWFEGDASDARGWLRAEGLIDEEGRPTWRRRRGSADPTAPKSRCAP
ncbi:MAG: hypothetical protein KDD47_12855 [Acidobacteria bacterium]|nr:hypothetical protein [Acidobacteriota bacterium]